MSDSPARHLFNPTRSPSSPPSHPPFPFYSIWSPLPPSLPHRPTFTPIIHPCLFGEGGRGALSLPSACWSVCVCVCVWTEGSGLTMGVGGWTGWEEAAARFSSGSRSARHLRVECVDPPGTNTCMHTAFRERPTPSTLPVFSRWNARKSNPTCYAKTERGDTKKCYRGRRLQCILLLCIFSLFVQKHLHIICETT